MFKLALWLAVFLQQDPFQIPMCILHLIKELLYYFYYKWYYYYFARAHIKHTKLVDGFGVRMHRHACNEESDSEN